MLPFSVNTHTHTRKAHTHTPKPPNTNSRGSKIRSPSSTPSTPTTTDGSTRGPQTAAPPPSASRGGPHRSRACSTLGSTASACVARAPPLPKRAERYLHKAVHAAKSQQV